ECDIGPSKGQHWDRAPEHGPAKVDIDGKAQPDRAPRVVMPEAGAYGDEADGQAGGEHPGRSQEGAGTQTSIWLPPPPQPDGEGQRQEEDHSPDERGVPQIHRGVAAVPIRYPAERVAAYCSNGPKYQAGLSRRT